jgi:glycosyltransferase involved in cell wall biosynthesis
MRILQVVSGLIVGGTERQLVTLSRELQRRGHRVLIYTLNRRLDLATELDGCGVELVADQKRVRLDPLVLARLRRTARDWGPDLAHGWLYDGNVYARIALRGLGMPVLDSERSGDYRLTWLQWLGYALTRGAQAALVANSHAGLAFARRLHGLPPDRAHVVWNGIDLAAVRGGVAAAAAVRASWWPGSDVRVACLVGSVTPPKDHRLALETAAALRGRDPRWRFVFVGRLDDRADCRRALEAQVRALGLQEACRFTGERRDALAHIAAADVLFSSSCQEGFPNVVLEAMACGTPVASTEYSDIRRILPFEWQVVRERSAARLADAIERAVREAQAVIPAQRAWVERHASLERAADRLESVYERYAGRQ